jgi:hypothetical protein
MIQQYVRILLILGMIAMMCGTVNAVMGIVAETQTTSAGSYPVCTAPCECISKDVAAQRWGAEGYEMCSKSICGQSANAMTQYYCLHQVGGTRSSAVTTAPTAAAQQTTQAPAQTTVQTQAEAPVVSVAVTAAPSSSYTWPSSGAVPQRTPVGIATILAAVGVVLLAAVVMRKK